MSWCRPRRASTANCRPGEAARRRGPAQHLAGPVAAAAFELAPAPAAVAAAAEPLPQAPQGLAAPSGLAAPLAPTYRRVSKVELSEGKEALEALALRLAMELACMPVTPLGCRSAWQ